MVHTTAADVLAYLEQHGLLLQQDKTAKSVVGLLTGEVLTSSWWSHARAHEIFAVLRRLEKSGDVLFAKLVAGKVTLVHRRLWPAVATVGISRERWQQRNLSIGARRLLQRLDAGETMRASGKDARLLQEKLLVHGTEIHTKAGRHEVVLEPWRTWCEQTGIRVLPQPAAARRMIEEAVSEIGGTIGSLPWHRFKRRSV